MGLHEVYINSIGTFLPNEPVTNNQMEALLGIAGNKPSRARAVVLRNNGIKTRYYAIDPVTGKRSHSNAEMTALAIRNLGIDISDIESLACGSSSPDQLLPSHAVMVHGQLGNPPCDIASFAGICVSGFQAVKYGYMSIRSGETQNAVCTGSELASPSMRGSQFEAEIADKAEALGNNPILAFEKDFLRWMLSDGAGAMWLQNRPGKGISFKIEWIETLSYANELSACMYQGGVKQADGSLTGYRDFTPPQIAEQSVLALQQDVKLLNEKVCDVIARALDHSVRKYDLDLDSIDYYLPHISSEYFRSRLDEAFEAKGRPIAPEKWFTNLSEVGNIGSAAIYHILAALRDSGKLQNGQKLLLMVPESGRFTMSHALLTVVA